MSKLNWEGVYPSREAIPFAVDTLDSQACVIPSIRRSKQLKKNADIYHEDPLLPIVVATLLGQKKVKVLDYGAGLGFTYLQLAQSLWKPDQVEFHVVETPSLCKAGNDFFAKDSRIYFHNEVPKLKNVDIIHARGVFQYIDNLDEIITQLVSLKAPNLLLGHLSAGNTPTYFTIQKYHGKKIPYRYMNFKELMSKFTGYEVIYKSQSHSMDQSNFPKKYRIGHTCNVLLKRK